MKTKGDGASRYLFLLRNIKTRWPRTRKTNQECLSRKKDNVRRSLYTSAQLFPTRVASSDCPHQPSRSFIRHDAVYALFRSALGGRPKASTTLFRRIPDAGRFSSSVNRTILWNTKRKREPQVTPCRVAIRHNGTNGIIKQTKGPVFSPINKPHFPRRDAVVSPSSSSRQPSMNLLYPDCIQCISNAACAH